MLRIPAIPLMIVSMALSISSAGQDYPKAEIFGGYSYLHIDTQGIDGSTLDAACNTQLGSGTCPPGTFQVHNSFNGWEATAQYNFTRAVGIKADFSGNYGMPLTLSSAAQSLVNSAGIKGFPPSAQFYSFLFGPVISAHWGRLRPFGHALFGDNRLSSALHVSVPGLQIPSLTVSDSAFAMAFGGGLDVKVSDRLSIRLGQGDYLYTKHDFSGDVPGVATHQNNFRVSAGIVIDLGGGTHVPKSHPSSARVPRPETIITPTTILSLGIEVVPHDYGAEIAYIQPGSPADAALLHVGDVINSVDGKAVKTPAELATDLSNRAPGTQVRLGYMFRSTALGWFGKDIVVVLDGAH